MRNLMARLLLSARVRGRNMITYVNSISQPCLYPHRARSGHGPVREEDDDRMVKMMMKKHPSSQTSSHNKMRQMMKQEEEDDEEGRKNNKTGRNDNRELSGLH